MCIRITPNRQKERKSGLLYWIENNFVGFYVGSFSLYSHFCFSTVCVSSSKQFPSLINFISFVSLSFWFGKKVHFERIMCYDSMAIVCQVKVLTLILVEYFELLLFFESISSFLSLFLSMPCLFCSVYGMDAWELYLFLSMLYTHRIRRGCICPCRIYNTCEWSAFWWVWMVVCMCAHQTAERERERETTGERELKSVELNARRIMAEYIHSRPHTHAHIPTFFDPCITTSYSIHTANIFNLNIFSDIYTFSIHEMHYFAGYTRLSWIHEAKRDNVAHKLSIILHSVL